MLSSAENARIMREEVSFCCGGAATAVAGSTALRSQFKPQVNEELRSNLLVGCAEGDFKFEVRGC